MMSWRVRSSGMLLRSRSSNMLRWSHRMSVGRLHYTPSTLGRCGRQHAPRFIEKIPMLGRWGITVLDNAAQPFVYDRFYIACVVVYTTGHADLQSALGLLP